MGMTGDIRANRQFEQAHQQRLADRHLNREQRRQAELDKRKRLQAEIDAMQSPVRVRSHKQMQKLREEIKHRIRVAIPSTGPSMGSPTRHGL